MEFEKRNRNKKNPSPSEGSSTLPKTVLIILVGIIILLLFIGWQYLNDTPSNAEEMIPTQPDVVSAQIDDADDLELEEDIAVSEGLPDISLPSSGVVTDDNKISAPIVEESEVVSKPEPIASTTTGNASHTHTVASGETFYSIATRYNLTVSTLQNYNTSIDPSNIKTSTKLKIPVQTIHTVGPGDILRVVAKKYDISLKALMSANGKSKNFAQRGEKLVIPFRTKK